MKPVTPSTTSKTAMAAKRYADVVLILRCSSAWPAAGNVRIETAFLQRSQAGVKEGGRDKILQLVWRNSTKRTGTRRIIDRGAKDR